MRGSTWRRALWRIGAAILIAIVLQLASAQSAHAGDAVCRSNNKPAEKRACLGMHQSNQSLRLQRLLTEH